MNFYEIARFALRLAGNVYTFVAVSVILLFAHGVYGHPLDALPAMFMWYLILGGCRFFGRAFPMPAAVSQVPKATPMPPSAIAVSITPIAPDSACPNFDAMASRLPTNVAQLLR